MTLTSSIDPIRAESVSRKVITATGILDDLAVHADGSDELRAEALAVGFIAQAVACNFNNIPLAEAVRQFRGFCKIIYRAAGRLGPDAKASEVIEEAHLNPNGESAR